MQRPPRAGAMAAVANVPVSVRRHHTVLALWWPCINKAWQGWQSQPASAGPAGTTHPPTPSIGALHRTQPPPAAPLSHAPPHARALADRRQGLAKKVDRSRKQLKERKNRTKKIRGIKKNKSA